MYVFQITPNCDVGECNLFFFGAGERAGRGPGVQVTWLKEKENESVLLKLFFLRLVLCIFTFSCYFVLMSSPPPAASTSSHSPGASSSEWFRGQVVPGAQSWNKGAEKVGEAVYEFVNLDVYSS